MHVIEQPNELGEACSLQQHSIDLLVRNDGALPKNINYRLGTEYPFCTPTVSETEAPNTNQALIITPNPASEIIHLSVEPENSDRILLRVSDLNGRVVHSHRGIIEEGTISMSIGHLAPGMYFCEMRRGQTMWVGKFIKI